MVIWSDLHGDMKKQAEMTCYTEHVSVVNRLQFADVKDASQQGKGKGQTFTWDVVSNVATAGGTLVETNTMPETQFTITQATLTINEYGRQLFAALLNGFRAVVMCFPVAKFA